MNIIFLHGGPGFSNYLEPFFKNIDESVNAVFYDQLKSESVSIDALVGQLDDYVNTLTGPTYIVGHSWGATLGLEYVARFEGKISGFILMSSGLNFNHWKIEFDLEKERRGLTTAPPEMIFLAKEERVDWSGFLEGMWDTFSDETFHSLYDGYIASHDLTSQFSKLKIPVLVIFGSEDVRFCPRVAKTLSQYNQNAELFEVVGAGHFPFLLASHREIVFDKILSFVRP